jgi:hypothetical protein
MDVKLRRHLPRNAQGSNVANVVEETVDISPGPFWNIGVITGLVSVVVSLAAFWGVTKPDADQRRALDLYRFQSAYM